jgi:protoporphyrinogen oxidase
MLFARYGRGIAERFLIPYNEKLYATDLDRLDREAMGRFFPHADLPDIIRNMKAPDNGGYNATFTYPEGGAIEYVKALQSEVAPGSLRLNEGVAAIDLARKVARTTAGVEVRYRHLVSSAPFPALLRLCGLPVDADTWTWNQVLVLNLGFDRKGPRDVHWIYYPERSLPFYRVGFYDNIFDTDRMSLYVELGYARDAVVDVEAARGRVLEGLRRAGVVTDQNLVSQHHVVMNPAYVHITKRSMEAFTRLSGVLSAQGVHSIGRYGGWTYCSIEDNVVEAWDLVRGL